jgi:hypothetical protein
MPTPSADGTCSSEFSASARLLGLPQAERKSAGFLTLVLYFRR